MNAKHYSYKVQWMPTDAEFVGTCLEFPSLSWLAESQESALQGIVNLVSEILIDMKANEEKEPLY